MQNRHTSSDPDLTFANTGSRMEYSIIESTDLPAAPRSRLLLFVCSRSVRSKAPFAREAQLGGSMRERDRACRQPRRPFTHRPTRRGAGSWAGWKPNGGGEPLPIVALRGAVGHRWGDEHGARGRCEIGVREGGRGDERLNLLD